MFCRPPSLTSRGCLAALMLALPGGLVAASETSPTTRHTLRNWQSEHGLPQNSVTALCPTREGYLWVGTLAGLARFDGERFKVFDPDNAPALRNGRVTALHEAPGGALWIGHETGDLTRLDAQGFAAVPVPAGWQQDVITTIGTDAAGDVWIHSRMGRLARLRDGRVLPPGGSLIDSYGVSSMAVTRDGRLWAVRAGELHRWQEDELQTVAQERAVPTNFVQAIAARRGGGLWVVRGARVFQVVDGQWTEMTNAPPHLTTTTRLIETAAGELVIGTIDRGLWVVAANGSRQNFNRTNGLAANWVGSFATDPEGNLWVGSASGGLSRLSPTEFESWRPADNWNGMPVLAVAADNDDALWIGTEGAGLYRLRHGEWMRFSTELSSKFVWTVWPDAAGRVWVGTWGGGLMVKNGGNFQHPPGMEQFNVPITAQLHTPDGAVWLGTRAGLFRFAAERLERVGPPAGNGSPDVRAIAQAPDGAIWFGMMGGGLGRVAEGKLQQFRKADGLPGDFILALDFDAQGALWIGTAGSGLGRLHAGEFAQIGVRHGLPSSSIAGVQRDPLGYTWLTTANGIYRVRTAELEQCAAGRRARLAGVTYGLQDGLETVECSGGFQPAIAATRDGRLWFPTRKGLVSIRPTPLLSTTSSPPVIIEEVVSDGHSLWSHTHGTNDAAAPLLVPPGAQRVEINFTGLGLAHPERLQFRYRLVGLDADWVEVGERRTASFTHPPPGRYDFRVQGSDYQGNWSETTASLAFTVQPFVWQTWWFRGVAYLLAAGGLAGAVGLAVRRRQRQKLELLTRQQELERERSRIARDIHDDLGASLTRISMLSQPSPAEIESVRQPLNRLEMIYDTTRELIRAMDEIVWAVNPEHDTLDSVANYLARFAQSQLTPAGIACRLHLPIEVPGSRVRAEVRHHLFLAFKEAIHNILKHAHATEVRFELALNPTMASFQLTDNGVGLTATGREDNTDRIASGQGIANMRRRLESVGGQCTLTVDATGGTSVRLSIPVEPTGDAESAGLPPAI